MVKERAQSPHPALVGSKRRIARRSQRRILREPAESPRCIAASADWRVDRSNALKKPIASTRPQRLATVEAAAAPGAARVEPALVASQRTLRARSASEASAAR